MGKIYKSIVNHLPETASGVFVEIGSERGEGSTIAMSSWAHNFDTKLITVDIAPDAKNNLEGSIPNTEFVISSGSAWAKEVSNTNLRISVLYLDNFDYIWDINDVSAAIRQQIHQYAGQGIVMSNQNCQKEHMSQIMALYPLLTPDAVVAFDDTYCLNDCWVGKCGPAVVFMLAQGWSVVEQTLDCGVIMKRLDNA